MSDVSDATLEAVRFLVEPWRSEVLMDAAKQHLGVRDVAPGGEGFVVEWSDGSTKFYGDEEAT